MFYEFKHPGLFEYFCKETGTNFSYPPHLHQSFEVIVILSGSMRVTVENKEYHVSKNQGVLIFPYQHHSLNSEECEHLLFIFSSELVRSYSAKITDKIPVNNQFFLGNTMIDTLKVLEENSSKVKKKGVLYLLCDLFDEGAEYIDREEDKENLLLQIFEYVEKNYKKDCSLKALSLKLNYDYTYLSRYMKERVGMSYNDYVNQYRISKACELLNNTDRKILECALECGYDSLRSFNRNFYSVMDMTPKEYREQKRS